MEDNNSNTIDPLFWLPSNFLDEILMDQDNLKTQLPTHSEKWGLVGSPHSILSPVLSNGSPNGPSDGPSSPTAPVAKKDDQSWNLICAAAGEVNMWKMKNENANKSKALPTPPNLFTPLPSSNKNTAVKQNNGSVWGQPFGVATEYGSGLGGNARFGRAQRPFQFGWPASQFHKQHFSVNGSLSGPNLLFPGSLINGHGGGVGLKRKCAGTGVFLPRTCPGPTDSKVKSGCPPSFTPHRPAQAFNVNCNNNVMMAQAKAQPPFIGGVTSDDDAMLMHRNAVLAQQWRNGANKVGKGGAMNCEVFLPLEWSY